MSSWRQGLLSDYFEAVTVKRLSAVEAERSASNQHEFNGTAALKTVFGLQQPARFPARFIWLGGELEGISEDGEVTWYDARANHPTRSEYRLYFPTTSVSELAVAGDSLFIARRTDGSVMVIVTPAESTFESQLLWLFGIENQPGFRFETRTVDPASAGTVDFAVRYILDELEIEPEEPAADRFDGLLAQFGTGFPSTKVFSEFARSTLTGISALDNPDEVLMAWIEREELLFRRLERRIVSERLRNGFMSEDEADVDGFLKFSLSVQNRRKARAGQSLENHLEALFLARGLRFDRGRETENANKPDFLFPGQIQYRDPGFSPSRLTMLGAKSTCKDRWRQVLSEAVRIHDKHLLTLEPGISKNQTAEMQAKNLQLVVPKLIQPSYRPQQQRWLFSTDDFIRLVSERQKKETG